MKIFQDHSVRFCESSLRLGDLELKVFDVATVPIAGAIPTISDAPRLVSPPEFFARVFRACVSLYETVVGSTKPICFNTAQTETTVASMEDIWNTSSISFWTYFGVVLGTSKKKHHRRFLE